MGQKVTPKLKQNADICNKFQSSRETFRYQNNIVGEENDSFLLCSPHESKKKVKGSNKTNIDQKMLVRIAPRNQNIEKHRQSRD